MSARAIWTGVIALQRLSVPIKLYSAVVDRDVHFHLLHEKDKTRLQQRMVNAKTGETVDRADLRKGFPVDKETYVLLDEAEVEKLAPRPSRSIQVTRFVPTQAIPMEWYDRPYRLGPMPGHENDYHALAGALANRKRRGIVHWVMRKKEYAGALCGEAGSLLLITLHRAEEVVAISDLEPPSGRPLSAEEESLAEKLVDSLSGAFQPSDFHDQYQDKLRAFVKAKHDGKKPSCAASPETATDPKWPRRCAATERARGGRMTDVP